MPRAGVTLLKMAVLVVVIVACFTKADTDNLQPFSEATQGEGGAQGIFQAMAISYHAYIGYDALTNAAEEVGMPRAVCCMRYGMRVWWKSSVARPPSRRLAGLGELPFVCGRWCFLVTFPTVIFIPWLYWGPPPGRLVPGANPASFCSTAHWKGAVMGGGTQHWQTVTAQKSPLLAFPCRPRTPRTCPPP